MLSMILSTWWGSMKHKFYFQADAVFDGSKEAAWRKVMTHQVITDAVDWNNTYAVEQLCLAGDSLLKSMGANVKV